MLKVNRLYNANCLELMKEIPDNSVNLVLIDPPYEINFADWDKPLDWKLLFSLFDRITTSDASIVIFQGWSSVCNTITNIPHNMTLKNWIIWDRVKGRGAKFNLVSTREDILWITKGNNYTFNKQFSNVKKKTAGLGLRNGNEYRVLSNVWTDISPIVPWSSERVEHPTQKPIQLIERCVKLWSNPGDLVLDCFSGSGTTALACYNTSRNFICIEKEKQYHDIAMLRLHNVSSRKKLF